MIEINLKYNSDKTLNFSTKSCAILGANGSGKSSLVKRFNELNKDKNIQFIRAQRNLNINQGQHRAMDDDSLETLLSSYSLPKIGSDLSDVHLSNEIVKNFYNNIVQNDFNKNIEKLYRDDMYLHANASRRHLNRPITKAEKIFNIWNSIFINKNIEIDEDGKIKIREDVAKYEIENLSDGERSALYLITKCVYAHENGIIIVDEGETHLNSALLHDLWDNIEEARPDCRFVYISHNIDFITSRTDCTKFWIKNFIHPEDWAIEEIQNDDLPEELILQIIGSKKEKILFVEGVKGGEQKLYQKIYESFKVFPVGSCENVINFTEAFNKNPQNYNKSYYGLIDRDFRKDENLNKLESKKIFSLPVSEYENLFFREEIIKFIFNYLGRQDFDEKFEQMKKEVFNLRENKEFRKDYYKNYIQEKFNQTLANFETGELFKFEDNYTEINLLWKKIEEETDFTNFLKILNAKDYGLKGPPVNVLELGNWGKYKETVLNIFNTEKKEDLKNVFLEFMPDIK